MARFLDFEPLSYDSLNIEGDHAVAFINVGIKDTEGPIRISEHWHVRAATVIRIRMTYVESEVRMDVIARRTWLA